MTEFENFLESELKTEFEIKLQLTSSNLSCRFSVQHRKNVLKNKAKLFEDKQILFSLLGDKQKFKFRGI